MTLSPTMTAWKQSGKTTQIFGHSVFYHDLGPRDAPPIVMLHGFPTSSHDFHAILPELSKNHRVICHDHLGFGFSDKPASYSYSLIEQAEVAMALWRHLEVQDAHLFAHDYGTSVATEIISRVNRELTYFRPKSLTLSNGSVYIHLAKLTFVQQLTRIESLQPAIDLLMGRFLFGVSISKVFYKMDNIDEKALDAMWEAILFNQGIAVLTKIQRYLSERSLFFDRWTGALCGFSGPAHILWGRKDPVAIPAIADALSRDMPSAKLTWLDGLGHYPMLEGPDAFVQEVLKFVEALD